MEKSPQYLASRRLLVTISITVFVELSSTEVEVRSVEFLRMLITTEGTVHMESSSFCVKPPNSNESQFSCL